MGRRKYVLIVDDCQQDRMAVADVLRSDYDILEAYVTESRRWRFFPEKERRFR